MREAGLIDGKAVAELLQARVAREVKYLGATQDLVPALAVVLVGNNPASQVYVKAKSKRAVEAGLRAIDCTLPETASEQDVLELVDKLNGDKNVHGILVQLPLPSQVRADRILRTIDPSKDVDGFHPINAGYLAQGQAELGFVPCTPLGCLMLLRSCMADISGKNAVVIERTGSWRPSIPTHGDPPFRLMATPRTGVATQPVEGVSGIVG